MATRRDQLQSYQFLLQRVVSALVYRKTDPAQSPFRKAGGAVFAGVMISILALAATVAISFFASNFGTNKEWWHGGVIVLEEDTGTKYVVFPTLEDATEEFPQRLYPVTNFASAVLLAGTTDTMEVSRNSLTGEDIDDEVPPRGMPIGIAGAPDSIPAPDQLMTDSRATVCTSPQENEPLSLLYVGATLSKGDNLDSSQAVVISEGDETYLVDAGGFKHFVPEPNTTLNYIGLGGASRATVAPGFTKALPTGEDLVVPHVPNLDQSSDLGQNVGTVFEHTVGANTNYYVALQTGAARITELQAMLLAGEHGQSGYVTGEGAQNAAVAAQNSEGLFYPDVDDEAAFAAALPLVQPEVPDNWHSKPACIAYSGDTGSILVNATLPTDSGIDTQQVSNDGNVLADRIVMPPGRGMLVRTGENVGAFSLIVSGQTYPITRMDPNQEQRYEIMAATDPLEAMKYGEDMAAVLNPELLSLIPTGPALDAHAAIATAFNNCNEEAMEHDYCQREEQ